MKKTNEKAKKKNSLKIIGIILGLLVVAVVGLLLFSNKDYKMNEKVTIKDENLEFVVKSVESYTKEPREEFSDLGWENLDHLAGEYVKVFVEITNTGNTEHTWLVSNFQIVDKKGDATASVLGASQEDFPDMLNYKIPAKQTISGYVYFQRSFEEELTLAFDSITVDGIIRYPVKLD